jgi:hypothetical protein
MCFVTAGSLSCSNDFTRDLSCYINVITSSSYLSPLLPTKLTISSLWRQECENCGINKSCVCVCLRNNSKRNSQQRMNITLCAKFAGSDSEACAMLSETWGIEDTRKWAFCGGIHSSESKKTCRRWKGRMSTKAQTQCVQTQAKYGKRRSDTFHCLLPPYLITW